ncbi:uncharacterized protein LOC143546442 [Bidens hawaiensis]|uniref:uncharacterized protein LOC143546442 n=1 Tax=Bidens hawaiensis TaxID=980011 RepID=UPI0040490191
MLNQLDVINSDCILKVRILKLWHLNHNSKPGEDWSIEMIVQDEMGNKIQAYVRKLCIPKHDVWLGENRPLSVRKASLGANMPTYRYIDCPHKLCFTAETHLSNFYEFEDNVYVNSSYGNTISQLLINDYLYEIVEYKKRLLETSAQVEVEIPKPVSSSMLLTAKDEFMKKAPFYSISDLCNILEAKSVIIHGTVKAILSNKEWYYNGCKRCGRKSENCNYQGVNAGPRFRIPIRVQDTTGVVSLTLFDRAAKQLFNKTTEEVVIGDAESIIVNDLLFLYNHFKFLYMHVDVMQALPEEVNVILEKKFAFIIDVTDYNIKTSYDVFGVSKLTDDDDVVYELETKFTLDQPSEQPSLTVGSVSGMKSADTLNEKASSTPSSDQVTPIHDCADLKLKRKLD